LTALVSIIIPTYNRSCLLGATLESILAQTYNNWECIVVDDGSIDYTEELMHFYCEKDNRIQFHPRPVRKLKGANACRNYGFELSKGKYIQWFDSDDLMVPEFLEIKVKAMEENEIDFVISKAANFQDPNVDNIISENLGYYRFEKFEITHYNYVVQKVNWLTYDFLGKWELCERVKFNERLKSAQERNFFSRITCYSVKAKVLDVYLTKRRIHAISTQARFKNNSVLREREHLHFLYETWKDLYSECGSKESLQYLFDNALKITLTKKVNWYFIFGLTKAFISMKKYKTGFWYLSYQTGLKLTNRGNVFRRKFLNMYKVV